MTQYFDEVLLIPIILLPLLFAVKFFNTRTFFILFLSFLLASVVNIFSSNSLGVSMSLIGSIGFFYILTSTFFKKLLVRVKNQYAIVIDYRDEVIVLYDGKQVLEVPYYLEGKKIVGRVVRITKLIDF